MFVRNFLKATLISFVAVSHLFLLTSNIHAQEASLEFTTDHVAGKFEKVKEKITLLFKFDTNSKVEYYQHLAEKRLAELDYAANNDIDSVEPTASRYNTYIGIMTEFVDSKKVTAKKDSSIEMLERHNKILKDLQNKFEANSGWWLMIQHGINNTESFASQLKAL